MIPTALALNSCDSACAVSGSEQQSAAWAPSREGFGVSVIGGDLRSFPIPISRPKFVTSSPR
eukprot:2637036-Alexandrium_andersonii.AAC.1